MALNDTSELEAELRTVGEEYTDLDLNRYLRRANNKLAGMVGRQFIDRQVIQIEDVEEVNLSFTSLESFDQVVSVSDGNEVIDPADYTVDNATGVVTFDSGFADDNIFKGLELQFYYVPTLFKDLELVQAAELALSQQTVVTADEVVNTQVQRYEETIKNLMKDINSRASVGVQRGDNINRGSNAPETLGRN